LAGKNGLVQASNEQMMSMYEKNRDTEAGSKNYDEQTPLPLSPIAPNLRLLSRALGGTNSGAVAGDVTFRAASVAGALLRMRAVPADVASARAVVAF